MLGRNPLNSRRAESTLLPRFARPPRKSRATKHVELLVRFGEACGVGRSDLLTTRQLPSTRALTAWCAETARQPFHIAAAELLAGLETEAVEAVRQATEIRWHSMTGVHRACVLQVEA